MSQPPPLTMNPDSSGPQPQLESIGQWAWKSVLQVSVVGATAALAMGYIRQPNFVTQWAKGPLFVQDAYCKGFTVGLIAAPAVLFAFGWAACCAVCVPCCWPVLFFFGVTGGDLCGKTTGEFGAAAIFNDLLKKVVNFALLLGVQGALMRVRFYPRQLSTLSGLFAGSALIAPVWARLVKSSSSSLTDSNPTSDEG